MLTSMTFTSVLSVSSAFADEFDTKIQEQDKKINDLKIKEKEAEAKLAEIEAEMVQTATKVDELKKQKEQLTKEIKKLYAEISDLTVRIQKREVQMQKQARDVQITGGGTNYLDVIINAKSISEVITRVQGLTTLVNANNDLLKQQQEDKDEVEAKTRKVEAQIRELEAAEQELNTKQNKLKTLKIQQEVAKNELEAQRVSEENKKNDYVKQKEEAQKRLAAEQARQKAAAEKAKKEAAEAAALAQSVQDSVSVSEQPPMSEINTGDVSGSKQAAIKAAIADIGNSYPTGWGQQGECIVSVRRWLNAGNIHFAVGGPHSGYTASGAREVSWSNVQPGDVVQYENMYSPDGWMSGVHTLLVVGVNGDGTAQIVEANNPAGSGYVSMNTRWAPRPPAAFRAVVWRFPG